MTDGNEAAFARPVLGEKSNGMAYCYCYGGLTKREWFAGMAMRKFISTYQNELSAESFKSQAKASVAYADAMIAELSKSKPSEGLER